MDALLRIIAGLFMMLLGLAMTWKTHWFLGILGSVPTAERWFGGGGTRFFYKLCGIAFIFLGIIVMTNLFGVLFGGFILSLFGL